MLSRIPIVKSFNLGWKILKSTHEIQFSSQILQLGDGVFWCFDRNTRNWIHTKLDGSHIEFSSLRNWFGLRPKYVDSKFSKFQANQQFLGKTDIFPTKIFVSFRFKGVRWGYRMWTWLNGKSHTHIQRCSNCHKIYKQVCLITALLSKSVCRLRIKYRLLHCLVHNTNSLHPATERTATALKQAEK